MDIKNIKIELQKAPIDKSAGIKIIKLHGNQDISVYVAEISPNTALNPHYHSKGIECYQIIEGIGNMKTGKLLGKNVNWEETVMVEVGDCFNINNGVVHQIVNESESPLRVIFICPESHMSSDRYFVNLNTLR